MENAQVRHLAEQYYLSRDSRLARVIVQYTNAVLAAEEKRRQVERVRPGELLLRTHRGPVVVTLLADEEARTLRHHPPKEYEAFMEFYGRRMARVLTEAYTQNGLLSYAELQWVFLASTGTVSRALDHYQRKHQVILPCPGTVRDMGRMLTHKNLIVRLHLQGLCVLEIARRTYHNPRSVDAYLKAFDSALILHLYGLPPRLMASVLGHGESLIQEYLELIHEYLKEPNTMREHLRQRGVNVPAYASDSG